jgi:hypothetical protein
MRCISYPFHLIVSCLANPLTPFHCKKSLFLIIQINIIFSASYPALCGCRVADPHHLDADAVPAFHFDADPDPDPTFHSDADLAANPDPTLQFDGDTDTDPTLTFFQT